MIPMASASAAGKRPRRTRIVHQSTARLVSAFGRTAKNFHSFRSRRRRMVLLHRFAFDDKGQRCSRYHTKQREAGIVEQGAKVRLASVAAAIEHHVNIH